MEDLRGLPVLSGATRGWKVVVDHSRQQGMAEPQLRPRFQDPRAGEYVRRGAALGLIQPREDSDVPLRSAGSQHARGAREHRCLARKAAQAQQHAARYGARAEAAHPIDGL